MTIGAALDSTNRPTNTLIAAQTWMPSICLPAGFSEGGLPVGIDRGQAR